MRSERGKMETKSKVLVHLLRFTGFADELLVPMEITQRGIADATGVKLTHISRVLKTKISEGLVSEKKAHVEGIRRRVKVYFLTRKGMEKANEIMASLEKIRFPAVVDGEKRDVDYSEIKDRVTAGILEVMDMVEKEGYADVDSLYPQPVGTALVYHPPEIERFVGRSREMEELSSLIGDEGIKVLIVFGNPGYGKTTLLFNVLRKFAGKANMLWYPVNGKTKLRDILNAISSFLSSLGKPGLEALLFENRPVEEFAKAIASRISGTKSILIFDGYGEMRDEVVEFFLDLLQFMESIEGVKLILTAREDTPYYSRFYGPKDVEKGTVHEYHLSGLSLKDTGEFLGMKEGDALKKIHLFTKGNPALLKMLLNRDFEGLKSTGRFSIEEINMLLYLSEKD